MFDGMDKANFVLTNANKKLMKPIQSIKSISLSLVTIVLLIFSYESNAQRNFYRRYNATPTYFVALEGGIGTTNFTFKSDVADLKDLNFYSQGWNAGLSLGTDAVKLRLNVGQYNFKKSSSQTIYQNLGSININLSPVKLFSKVKYFRAYVVTGVDYSLFSFDGIKVPKYIDPNPPVAATSAACCCPTGSAPEEEVVAATLSVSENDSQTVDPKTLSLKKAQINTGLGFEFSLSRNKRFYKMFAEAHYGIPMKEIINDLSLNKTSLTGQMVINLGFGFGIAR